MTHLRLLFLALVYCSSTVTVGAYHAVLRELLRPFLTCAVENNIPRDNSLTGNLNNDIDTIKLGFDEIMNCIDVKIPILRESYEPLSWYIGQMFDFDAAMRLKSNLTNSAGFDFTCLDSDSEHYRREVCFNSTYVALAKICEISHQFNVSTETDWKIICNGGTFMWPGSCSMVGKTCASGMSEFLQHVFFPILVGKYSDCETLNTTKASSFTQMTLTPRINILQTEIFTCAKQIFNDTLEQLFLPSMSTVKTVTNVMAAKALQKQFMQKFCEKHQEYSQCVRAEHDYFVWGFIQISSLGTAFDIYCENQELISSQYECTFNAVSESSCAEGVEDFLSLDVDKLENFPSVYSCNKMSRAMFCRLQQQLNKCSPQFVSMMKQFYQNIIVPMCFPLMLRSNPNTEVMPCFASYAYGLNERISPNETSLPGIITREMDNICQNEMGNITDCLIKVFSNPHKPMDLLWAKIYAARNIKPLANRLCALVPALKPNLECIIKSFGNAINETMHCVALNPDEVEIINRRLNDTEQVLQVMRGLYARLKPCFVPVFTSCDATLGKEIGSLIDEISTLMNDPNYQIKEKDRTSEASSVSGTIII